MLQIDNNLQELPQKRNPKAVLEGQIEENGLWVAQVLSSGLYKKRSNIQEIRTTFAEILDHIEDWQKHWNPDNVQISANMPKPKNPEKPSLSWWENNTLNETPDL